MFDWGPYRHESRGSLNPPCGYLSPTPHLTPPVLELIIRENTFNSCRNPHLDFATRGVEVAFVGTARWTPPGSVSIHEDSPPPSRCLPGGLVEISAPPPPVQELTSCRAATPTAALSDSPVWSEKETDGFCKATVNGYQFNQPVLPILHLLSSGGCIAGANPPAAA